jgi:IMP dehydrogenase
MISDPVGFRDREASPTRRSHGDLLNMGIPIVDPQNGRLVGIITNPDRRFCGPEDMQKPVSEFMTSKNRRDCPRHPVEGAKALLRRTRTKNLPHVDREGKHKGLIPSRTRQNAE